MTRHIQEFRISGYFMALTSGVFKISVPMALCLASFATAVVQAQTPPTAPVAPSASATPAAAATPPAAPGSLRPMKDILKDAKSTPGFFNLHQDRSPFLILNILSNLFSSIQPIVYN
jgi:hypothetical protein